MDSSQFAKDLQDALDDIVSCSVYYGEPPRDEVGGVSVSFPFVVYTYYMYAPEDEAGIFTADLMINVWGNNGLAEIYAITQSIDDAIWGETLDFTSGLVCADRNGGISSRSENDPDDERIRRLNSQYLLRIYPSIITSSTNNSTNSNTEQETE